MFAGFSLGPVYSPQVAEGARASLTEFAWGALNIVVLVAYYLRASGPVADGRHPARQPLDHDLHGLRHGDPLLRSGRRGIVLVRRHPGKFAAAAVPGLAAHRSSLRISTTACDAQDSSGACGSPRRPGSRRGHPRGGVAAHRHWHRIASNAQLTIKSPGASLPAR